ncbi:MAG: S41 family peptidase [Burkholderiaceae bacterium]
MRDARQQAPQDVRMMARPIGLAGLAPLLIGALLSACGGGGGGGDAGGGSSNPPPVSAGQPLQPSSSYAQRCDASNPFAASAQKTGSLALEKQWLRAYFDEAYLWPDEVPGIDAGAAAYSGSDVRASLEHYFEALKSPRLTDSGARRDRFSFMLTTAEWNQSAQGGVELGYGIEWHLASATPPRHIRVAYVEAGSPAAAAGVLRGDELLSADGVGADAGDAAGVATLNEALYPGQPGAAHQLVFSRQGAALPGKSLVGATVSRASVPLHEVIATADGGRVGHLVFNDHLAGAEAPLIAAMQDFKAQGVTDLVLDLRYNGGGYLFIASELAYMITGPARIDGRVFERLNYNGKRSAENESTPFYTTACLYNGSSCTSQQALPTLNLARVYVLTQDGTCSASEAVINGLMGVDVEVIQIGGSSCGKPYGFHARDNCGLSYFPIEFVGVNAKGFGDYADGFTPVARASAGGRKLPGCQVADDFDHPLGDRAEGQFAAALSYRASGQCPAASGLGLARTLAAAGGSEGQARLTPRKAPARSNRIAGGR